MSQPPEKTPARDTPAQGALPLGNTALETHGHGGRAGEPAAKDWPGATPAGVVYTCPMHPEVRQDHLGACPKCGMTLQPVPAGQTPPEASGASGSAAGHHHHGHERGHGHGHAQAPQAVPAAADPAQSPKP
ncbi:heavy metal-binding domain-containing protein, partial [Pandoraea apista]